VRFPLRVVRCAALLFVTLAIAGDASAVDPWKLAFRKGTVAVYTDDSQALPRYKAEGLIDANIFDLLAVLADVGRRPQWVRNLVEIRWLAGDVESLVTFYEQYYLPWPCNNRDSVVESTITKDNKRLTVSVDFHEVVRPDAPVRSGVTRMPAVRGSLFFQYVDKGHSYARLVMSIDVGGQLPGWAVKHYVREAPVMTMEGLAAQVKRTRGLYRDFVRAHVAEARREAEIPFEVDLP
jgi:hypothetical protein